VKNCSFLFKVPMKWNFLFDIPILFNVKKTISKAQALKIN
jgi:hypothetical protein